MATSKVISSPNSVEPEKEGIGTSSAELFLEICDEDGTQRLLILRDLGWSSVTLVPLITMCREETGKTADAGAVGLSSHPGTTDALFRKKGGGGQREGRERGGEGDGPETRDWIVGKLCCLYDN